MNSSVELQGSESCVLKVLSTSEKMVNYGSMLENTRDIKDGIQGSKNSTCLLCRDVEPHKQFDILQVIPHVKAHSD